VDAAEEGADWREAGVFGGSPAGGAVGFGARDHRAELKESKDVFVAADAALAVDGAAGRGDKDGGGDEKKKGREKKKEKGGKNYFKGALGQGIKFAIAGDVFQKPGLLNF